MFANCLRGPFSTWARGPRGRYGESDMAIQHMRNRSLLIPEFVPQPPTQTERIGRSSVILILIVIAAIGGRMLSPFFDEAPKQVSDFWPLTSWDDGASAETSAHPAHLVVESQKGFTNEPLPLGISLDSASGGETVTVTGLADG